MVHDYNYTQVLTLDLLGKESPTVECGQDVAPGVAGRPREVDQAWFSRRASFIEGSPSPCHDADDGARVYGMMRGDAPSHFPDIC